MTSLTELCKKGELPSGYYYVKNEFGNIFPSDYSEDYDHISDTVIKDFFTEVSEITEVLAPVPSYKEYQQLLSDQLAKDEGVEINAELENRMNLERELCKRVLEENDKLKTENKWYSEQLHGWVDRAGDLEELLKECKDEINPYVEVIGGKKTFKNLIDKINEVLK